MSINTNINTEMIKTPSQDVQGRWYELLSPTQHGKVKKKTKCRGDRKVQRRRRRLRQKGLCPDAITKNGDQELNVQ
ncbi:unnamed protein product [Rotaria sp. Silwood2]|nr:unnamed protein product [Rotaria sp. Silwood2]